MAAIDAAEVHGGIGPKYVNTEIMESTLSGIENQINRLNTAIENYSAQATSLGQSSFRGNVEANLAKIKQAYLELEPVLNKMKTEITNVKEAYNLSASNISAA